MQRWLMVSMLALAGMYGSAAAAQQCPGKDGWVFDDVPASSQFCAQVTWLAQNDISMGCAVVAPGTPGAPGMNGAPGDPGAPGADGKTLLSNASPPAIDDGTVGDFYIDTEANYIYGPKSVNGWGSGVSVRGPQGDYMQSAPVTTILGNYAVQESDYTVFCNTVDNSIDVYLPSAGLYVGRIFVIKRTGPDGNTCTVHPPESRWGQASGKSPCSRMATCGR